MEIFIILTLNFHQVITAPIDDPMERDLAIFDLYNYDQPIEVGYDFGFLELGLKQSIFRSSGPTLRDSKSQKTMPRSPLP